MCFSDPKKKLKGDRKLKPQSLLVQCLSLLVFKASRTQTFKYCMTSFTWKLKD